MLAVFITVFFQQPLSFEYTMMTINTSHELSGHTTAQQCTTHQNSTS